MRLYYDEQKALRSIPTLRMISTSVEELKQRAEKIVDKFPDELRKQMSITSGKTEIGGGSYPGALLDSVLISIKPQKISVNELEKRCRLSDPPLIGRIQKDEFLLDLRTVLEKEDEVIKVIISNNLT